MEQEEDASSLLYGDVFTSWERNTNDLNVNEQKENDDEEKKGNLTEKIQELERKESLFHDLP
jgi:hypothetical protein